jgi:hypothetical protein
MSNEHLRYRLFERRLQLAVQRIRIMIDERTTVSDKRADAEWDETQ